MYLFYFLFYSIQIDYFFFSVFNSFHEIYFVGDAFIAKPGCTLIVADYGQDGFALLRGDVIHVRHSKINKHLKGLTVGDLIQMQKREKEKEKVRKKIKGRRKEQGVSD